MWSPGATAASWVVAAELTQVKAEPGGDIVLTGSPSLVRSLLATGVLDELNLLVHPVVLGSGGRLFDEHTAKTALTLTEAEPFRTGVLNLTYTTTGAVDQPAGPGIAAAVDQ